MGILIPRTTVFISEWGTGAVPIKKCRFTYMREFPLFNDRLIFIIQSHMPEKSDFIYKRGPGYLLQVVVVTVTTRRAGCHVRDTAKPSAGFAWLIASLRSWDKVLVKTKSRCHYRGCYSKLDFELHFHEKKIVSVLIKWFLYFTLQWRHMSVSNQWQLGCLRNA